MLDFLELEETVGRAWHRFAGDTRSFPRHPQAAVSLARMRPLIGPFFRAMGGEAAVQIAPARAKSSSHRLRLRQYVGLGEERIEEIGRDHQSLLLPETIDFFADEGLNRDLYLWLAAFMAMMPRDEGNETPGDPLAADLAHVHASVRTAHRVLHAYPGLRPVYGRLADGMLDGRSRGSLPRAEQIVEDHVLRALSEAAGQAVLSRPIPVVAQAPRGYLPMLPVPLWPRFVNRGETAPRPTADAPQQGAAQAEDGGRKMAVREDPDRSTERSPFILNRFEKILSLSEMLSVDRPADDSDDDNAKTADDLEDVTLGERRGKPASRFRFDLDLPPEALVTGRAAADIRYPEWDYRRQAYLPDQVGVKAGTASADAGPESPAADMHGLIRRVRKQFEILRPRNQALKGALDGPDLDLDRVVRRHADLLAGGEGTDRIHVESRPREHDLAVTLLTDVSLSTDSWVDNRRVLDVEKEALLVLAHGLSACGDRYAIETFTSRRRDWVRIETVKGFDEPMSERVEARIAGLKPGYYTRMGAAIRHSAAGLAKQPNARKLLLLLTDGKPNDVDYYEGRYALEDTRKAVQEARRAGLSVFAVTVDRNAQTYLPALFGTSGFAMVGSLARLPKALPAIYRSLAG